MYDLIIIGAGPAGVSAGIYAARQRLKILIISKDLGGQVAKKAVDIENYPGFEKISGPDLVELYDKQLKANKLEVVTEEVINIEKKEHSDILQNVRMFTVGCKSGKIFEAVSVIIASGAESKKIKVPGEDEFEGKGVSYCSLCDGPIFKNKVVAVVGGGNNGFESALFLSNYVKKIYVLEYGDKINADAENQELVAKNSNIEVVTNAKVLRIGGKPARITIPASKDGVSDKQSVAGGGFVNSIVYQDLKSGAEKVLEVNGVFVEIGYSPATLFAKDLVELNDKKEIIFNPETLETKTPGLFSAGDCNVSRYKQIVMASGEGAKAALSAYNYIKKNKK